MVRAERKEEDMPAKQADPGYGDPLAPVGSSEWAKRWRLEFQNVIKSLPQAPTVSVAFYKKGEEYRAWTLLTDGGGRPFLDFDSFCSCRQPWGLGMDPAKFRAYLAAEVGERGAALITVPPGDDKGGAPPGNTNASKDKPTPETTGATVAPVVSGEMSGRTAKNLRAILRAPEVVQELYREGRIAQVVAAKLGPMSPTPEQAAQVAEVRQAIEALDRSMSPPKFRKEAARVVAESLGASGPTTLDILRRAWSKATPDERRAFAAGAEGDEVAALR
jgi:hypothetical protein